MRVPRGRHPGIVVDRHKAAFSGFPEVGARIAARPLNTLQLLPLILGYGAYHATLAAFKDPGLRLLLLSALTHVARRVAGKMVVSVLHASFDCTTGDPFRGTVPHDLGGSQSPDPRLAGPANDEAGNARLRFWPHFDFSNAARTVPKALGKLDEHRLRSMLGDRLDSSVPSIPNLPANLERPRSLASEVPKADPLNLAPDDDA